MKKFYVAALALVILLPSCTIRKRHYMPGYHVEWKHRASTSGTPNEQVEKENYISSSTQAENPGIKGSSTALPVETSAQTAVVTVVEKEDITASNNNEVALKEYTRTYSQEQTPVATKDFTTSHHKKNYRTKPNRTHDGGGASGLAMILIGILLLLLGLLFLAVLDVVGIIFWLIFGIAGGLLILIGLIVLILSLF